MALWTVVIGNYWFQVADVAVQVTSVYHKWYFVAFFVLIQMVFFNILTGALLDAVEEARDSGKVDRVERVISNRLDSTVGPSGYIYSGVWEVEEVAPYALHQGTMRPS